MHTRLLKVLSDEDFTCDGKHMTSTVCPLAELAVGNIVRRVLHMIREESQNVSTP